MILWIDSFLLETKTALVRPFKSELKKCCSFSSRYQTHPASQGHMSNAGPVHGPDWAYKTGPIVWIQHLGPGLATCGTWGLRHCVCWRQHMELVHSTGCMQHLHQSDFVCRISHAEQVCGPDLDWVQVEHMGLGPACAACGTWSETYRQHCGTDDMVCRPDPAHGLYLWHPWYSSLPSKQALSPILYLNIFFQNFIWNDSNTLTSEPFHW